MPLFDSLKPKENILKWIIFCFLVDRHREWAREYGILDVTNKVNETLEAIESAIRTHENPPLFA